MPDELNQNIKSAYEYGVQLEETMGLICMFNEIKVEEGLDWCPWTNAVIGLCQEHSSLSPHILNNLDDAQLICEDLQARHVHLGIKVS